MKFIINCYGGGSSGLATAKFLELIKFPKADLYSGTSIGGIIALALAYGYSGLEITELFDKNLKIIFKKSFRNFLMPISRGRYNSKNIENVLREYFQHKKLNELESQIFIPAHIWKSNITLWFKNNKSYTVFDAARATSAASTYFKPYKLNGMKLIDAGLYVNNPIMWTLIHALELWPEETFKIVSIGTGRSGENKGKIPISMFIIDDIIRIGIRGSEGLGHRALTTIAKISKKIQYAHYNFDIPQSIAMDEHDSKTKEILIAAAEKEYERVVNQKFL